MPETSQSIAIQHIESPQEEIPLPDFINDIKMIYFLIMETPQNIIKRRGLESIHLLYMRR
jgi:hypothetical protein